MDRLAKKCVIASSILHGTLVVVLLVGPAFFMSHEQPTSKDIIDFIPSQIIDANMTGGGNPNVATPPPQPPQPPVQQQFVQPPPRPEPQTEQRPEPKPEPKPEEVTAAPAPPEAATPVPAEPQPEPTPEEPKPAEGQPGA